MVDTAQLLAQADGLGPTPVEGTQTSTEAHGGGENFPPFDPANVAPQVLWLAIIFAVLYVVMSRLALPRIGGILETRQDRLTSDFVEAERLKDESERSIAAHQQSLAEARAKAQAIANATRDQIHAEANANRKQIENDLAARLAEAEAQIGETKQQALNNVRGIALDATSAIVARLLGNAPGQSEVETAVDAALKN
jgi:F-type H+-transporting ATPase subunit b